MKWLFYDKHGNVCRIFSEKPTERMLKASHICVDDLPLQDKKGYETIYKVVDGVLQSEYVRHFNNKREEKKYIYNNIDEHQELIDNAYVANAELFESILAISPGATPLKRSAATNNGIVNVYLYLIEKGIRTIDTVPEVIKDQLLGKV